VDKTSGPGRFVGFIVGKGTTFLIRASSGAIISYIAIITRDKKNTTKKTYISPLSNCIFT
jgi:hypothetical protein